ncbi:MAG: hypothetical protein ACFFAQ_08170 [Promethearchaeota archaeon]
MRNLKKSKQYILILLITIPTLLALSSLMTNVQGGPDDIPVAHPNNGWHWDVEVGDQIYFEGEFILTNASTGEIYMMFKDIWIYNITSINNVTIDAGYGVRDYSQVNATQCYNDLSELEAYDDSQELALFGYHDADPIKHKYMAGRNGMPFLLPINGSNFDVDIIAGILNESFYGSPMYQMAFNSFSNYSTGPGNRIYFYNETEGYFTDGTYFNNGTMEMGSAFLIANMGEGPVYINATMRQVFDYDITDEVEWGVSPGDTFYYDSVEDPDPFEEAMEWKINITGFSPILFNKTKNGFSEEEPVYMVYEVAYADRSWWNGTDYEFMDNVIVGAANNFYPQYYDDAQEENIMPFLWPINIPREHIEFMWNNDTLRISETMQFDEIHYNENGYYDVFLRNSTGTDYVRIIISKTTGMANSFEMFINGSFMLYELKTHSLVDWSVNIGDIIYFKQNDDYENGFRDVKATIIATYTYFANLTFIEEYYNYYGIPWTLPSGQPEYQFFSCPFASYEGWNPSTLLWDYGGTDFFAIANIYWPISPIIFEMRLMPILMPEDTSVSELTNIFDAFSPVYDDITYSTGHVILRNSTLDRTLHFYFDEASGRMTMMDGWGNLPGPGGGWNYMSVYPKFYRACAPGTHSFPLQSDFITDMTVNVEFDVAVGGPGVEYIYNFLPYNPVNASLPNGTALAYFDQLIVNNGLIVGNLTMTITFPSSLDLHDIAPLFFAYNMSGTLEWDPAPPDFYASIIYDYGTNSITIEMEAWGPMGVISAMSYIPVTAPEEEPIIPGYNVIVFIIGILIVSGIIIKRQRK